MFPTLPEDVIAFVKEVFAEANARTSALFTSQPAMHEEMLDFQLIAELNRAGPRLLPSGAAAVIETHWLGGRRHWGRWEISDIALVVVARAQGGLIARKVALLQTKRLYSRELPVATLDRSDYEIGIGRLADRTEKLVPLFHQRAFSFSGECVYGALQASSEQVGHIEEYARKRAVPVYYGLYNPSALPSGGSVPGTAPAAVQGVDLGMRILTMHEVHGCLAELPVGTAPTFGALAAPSRETKDDRFAAHGWRVEEFVAEHVMRCREGRVFDRPQDEILYGLLYERSAPIQAAVVVTVDLPGEAAGG